MKIPLWCLLLLLACLFTPGRADCQGQCAACSLLLQQQQQQQQPQQQQQQQLEQAFNAMVCLLECKGHVSASLTWEECKRALKMSQPPLFPEGGALLKRTGGELEFTSFHLSPDADMLQEDQVPLEQYDSPLLHSSPEVENQDLDLDMDLELDGGMKPREERNAEESDGEDSAAEEEEDSAAVSLSKRFGGFQRGRHGYRKLVGSAGRPLQKRYGGFIGVRKSARKWNSQKRVNQLLRQYLGLRSSRGGRFNNGPVNRVWRQNKL